MRSIIIATLIFLAAMHCATDDCAADRTDRLISNLDHPLWTAGRDAAQTGACQVIDVGPATDELLMRTGWTVRWAAVRSLGLVGKGNQDALPSLTVALMDGEWQVRGVAALAIGQFGIASTSGARSALADKLQDENAAVRKAAAIALGEIGPPARSSIASVNAVYRCPVVSKLEMSGFEFLSCYDAVCSVADRAAGLTCR